MSEVTTIKQDFLSKFGLPVSYGSNEDFHSFLFDKLSEFTEFVTNNTCSIDSNHCDLQPITGCSNNISLIVENIKEAFNEYYNGRPDVAYATFERVLVELLQFDALPECSFHKESFYRIRTDKTISSRKDIFHIPFSKRTLVAPQRYSIAGFPCLYLANSIYVAWEEFNRPPIDTFNFAKFQFSTPANFINFSPIDFQESIENVSELLAFFQKIILYPILLICSVKVSKSDNPFKPEYIFSQFTLRWCKEKDQYDGVMYGSTRIHDNSKGKFYNFAIPVSDYQLNTEICPELTQKMKLTKPYNISKIIYQNDTEDKNNVILEIFSKELHKRVPFRESIFAHMENFLQTKELGSVTR
ncbi:hypothetical protein VB796_04410 [Arcicella sp. LKC2W]|uniref:hypothetical protein n=1 Tax=Arcicella sp. LKC2W TaxID=2984198 RepID=UPI002B21035D|nr:hypothetical protein [Arcicella sp. LKC2W]MEA5458264.1 hypothetical protein [Arcicella sp. LKC2W]